MTTMQLGTHVDALSHLQVGGRGYGTSQVMLPSLDIAPPSVLWAKQEIAIDAFHHGVYARATGLAYQLLDAGNGR